MEFEQSPGLRAYRRSPTSSPSSSLVDLDGDLGQLELEPLHPPPVERLDRSAMTGGGRLAPAWTTSERRGATAALRPAHVVAMALLVALSIVASDDMRLRARIAREGQRGYYDGLSSVSARRDDIGPGVGKNGPSGKPKYSILPRRLYSVVGLESSGTQFVTGLIQDAIESGSKYREGHAPCRPGCTDARRCGPMNAIAKNHPCDEAADSMAQHFSLPWGGSCAQRPDPPPVVDVVLPPQCTRDPRPGREARECAAMAREVWGVDPRGGPVIYPSRYQIDPVASRRWHERWGVEQVIVVVVRDGTISYTARSHVHCKDPELRRREEEVGTGLILDTINAFLLDGTEERWNATTYKRWVASDFQAGGALRRRLAEGGGHPSVPASNGVVLVSYETLMKLGDAYLDLVLEALGLERGGNPVAMRDSNAKYVNSTYLEDVPRI